VRQQATAHGELIALPAPPSDKRDFPVGATSARSFDKTTTLGAS
jgi:hypothetical protein